MSKVAPDPHGRQSGIWEKAQMGAARGKLAPLLPGQLKALLPEFSFAEIEEIVVPKRTLARRRARGEALTSDETDRALRLARITIETRRVFGNADKAARWLRKPNAALSGQTPLALLRSETGARVVDELLGQIDHGMFA